MTGEGYLIVLKPGQHPLVTEPMTAIVPYGNERASKDAEFHICIVRGAVRCLYVPFSG